MRWASEYLSLAVGNISIEDIVHSFEEMGIPTKDDLHKVISISRKNQLKFLNYANSFVMKIGPKKSFQLFLENK